MSRKKLIIIAAVALSAIIASYIAIQKLTTNKEVKIGYPFREALFPKEFHAPTFSWVDKDPTVKEWEISINLNAENNFYTQVVSKNEWKPRKTLWDSIKTMSEYKFIEVVIKRNNDKTFVSQKAKLKIKISEDELGAPILYRLIPLPFAFAEAHIEQTSYELYNASSEKPMHTVLYKFPVCGNCHSHTRDAKTIALDFDAVTRDKGGYFISKFDTITTFDKSNYISWTKLQSKSTFGLFSKISWNGKYVVTTIKDRVISEKFETIAQLPYSQLFFPVNGVLAIYDVETKQLNELPGANDLASIQSNAVWTPDDKYLIFAKAKALPYPDSTEEYRSFITDKKVIQEYVERKRTLQYDLYKIPFNNGKGGKAEPIEGASNNGKSNYFPAASPDGKWIIYCQSENFMMLQPDSKLFIVPVEGGKARELYCNLYEMNSWHSWSPNSKWIVWESKYLSIYTDMFISHIDEDGNSSVPVLLEDAKRVNCATNYPEFINKDINFTFEMDYKYINTREIENYLYTNKPDSAKMLLEKFLVQSSFLTAVDYADLARIYSKMGEKDKAKESLEKSKQLDSVYFRGFKGK